MTTPQRFSKGVTNVTSDKTMGMLIIPDPTSVHMFMRDFDNFIPTEWDFTRSHTGSTMGSENLADADGGVLAFYPANADNDYTFFQFAGADGSYEGTEIFTIESGKKLWFKARLKVSDTGDSDFFIGLQQKGSTPLTAPANGVWFQSDDGDDYLDFRVYSGSASILADVEIATLADDTYFTVGFHWDGGGLQYFYNDAEVGETTSISPSTTEMTIVFGVQNGSAAARTMSLDYVCVIKER